MYVYVSTYAYTCIPVHIYIIHINVYTYIYLWMYSQLQMGWHSILRLFLKTFDLVPGVPKSFFFLLLLGTNRNIMGRILVRWKSFRNNLEILCHPICNWLHRYKYIHVSRSTCKRRTRLDVSSVTMREYSDISLGLPNDAIAEARIAFHFSSAYVSKHIQINIHTHIHMYIYIYTHIYTYIYILYIYIYMYI